MQKFTKKYKAGTLHNHRWDPNHLKTTLTGLNCRMKTIRHLIWLIKMVAVVVPNAADSIFPDLFDIALCSLS